MTTATKPKRCGAPIHYPREFTHLTAAQIPASRAEFERLHYKLASEGKIAPHQDSAPHRVTETATTETARSHAARSHAAQSHAAQSHAAQPQRKGEYIPMLQTTGLLIVTFFSYYGIPIALALAFVMGFCEHRRYCRERRQGWWF